MRSQSKSHGICQGLELFWVNPEFWSTFLSITVFKYLPIYHEPPRLKYFKSLHLQNQEVPSLRPQLRPGRVVFGVAPDADHWPSQDLGKNPGNFTGFLVINEKVIRSWWWLEDVWKAFQIFHGYWFEVFSGNFKFAHRYSLDKKK